MDPYSKHVHNLLKHLAITRCGYCNNEANMETVASYNAIETYSINSPSVVVGTEFTYDAGYIWELALCPSCDGINLRQVDVHTGAEPEIGKRAARVVYPSTEKTFINVRQLSGDKFIQEDYLPDDFYQQLINEINQLYVNQLPFSLSILIRKLIENLLIDILRKKYGTAEIGLYFDINQNRFQNFSTLVKNIKERKSDFQHISQSFGNSVLDTINKYRAKGNSGAHSIDTNLTIEQFAEDKKELQHLISLLLRIYQQVANSN